MISIIMEADYKDDDYKSLAEIKEEGPSMPMGAPGMGGMGGMM
jgi:hypothetical protein